MPALSLFCRRQRGNFIICFSFKRVSPCTKRLSCSGARQDFKATSQQMLPLTRPLREMSLHPHFYRWIHWVSQRWPQGHPGQHLNFLHRKQAVKWQSLKESIFRIKNVVGGEENISFNIRKGIKNSPVYTLLITARNSITADTALTIFPSIIQECLSKASWAGGRKPLRYT